MRVCFLFCCQMLNLKTLEKTSCVDVEQFLDTVSKVYASCTWKLPTIMSPAAQIQPVERLAVFNKQFWCFSITWA